MRQISSTHPGPPPFTAAVNAGPGQADRRSAQRRRPSPPAARATGRRPAGGSPAAGRTRPRPVSRSQICSSWARCSSITWSISGKSAARIAASVRSWISITQLGTSGACTAMSRAISSRRKRLRMSCTTVELRVARAIARWNFRSSWRNRSSCCEEVVRRRERALALDQRRHRGEVVLARVHGGELRHARLEQAARLEHAGHLAHADRLAAAQQVARDQLGGDEDAARLARGAPRARRPRRASSRPRAASGG